ncbi:uncharacterized protein LY79DRAFT_89123 [Colletotrichum navitas]|uniref:Uncharacterized protein n=1 Tax=Colletotrichum navitas TaxID=681940 RepID=A0AAD8Q4H8_9PEZI|nr:uncharacterized protein LY79DRAFT_89123 [Colletotrichum navitas]KAK1595717.1 hypothetical protein LY79DRAFT_89123 [Colletotrichum navitas]
MANRSEQPRGSFVVGERTAPLHRRWPQAAFRSALRYPRIVTTQPSRGLFVACGQERRKWPDALVWAVSGLLAPLSCPAILCTPICAPEDHREVCCLLLKMLQQVRDIDLLFVAAPGVSEPRSLAGGRVNSHMGFGFDIVWRGLRQLQKISGIVLAWVNVACTSRVRHIATKGPDLPRCFGIISVKKTMRTTLGDVCDWAVLCKADLM